MEPAPIQILSRAAFDLMLLSAGRHWVASIREQEADPIPRSEFFGNRINLAFYDLTDGPNIATAAHVEKVYRFSQRWAKAAHSDPTTASLLVQDVIHPHDAGIGMPPRPPCEVRTSAWYDVIIQI
jgi:hypothetical protein